MTLNKEYKLLLEYEKSTIEGTHGGLGSDELRLPDRGDGRG